MTYNFDPDRWLEAHRAALDARRDRGEVDEGEYRAELRELDRRYEEMVARLDGTYEIPGGPASSVE
ncbi:MAG: hypothetical protein LJE93_12020 [Acidobacteria bacterium]|nr:hypothetical protein [Acidobacteriota bacterium]